ncbi:unnamed protein product [Mytilus edulis]|uniref:Uncharacterized protein n=1 Tax=Mytilus edulis TaxID=6550 RepID=A0A8S3RXC5_MYTED|nr:unnamed protein product [Mytilus edulis]
MQGIDREVGPVHYDLDSNCSDAQSRRSTGAEYMSDQEAAVPTDRQNNTNTEHGRQMEIQAMEMRLKALETQTMQNLSIQTAMTTQLALQIQQQTIAKLQYPANLPTYIAPPSYTQPQHYSYTTPPYFHQNIQPPQMPLSGPSISMSHPRHMTPPNMFINHPPPLHPNYNMAAHSQTNMSTNQQIHSNREFSLPPQSSTAQPFMSNANVQNVQIPSQHLHDTTDRSPKEMYQNNQKVSSTRKNRHATNTSQQSTKDQQPDLLDQSAWMFQAKLANRSGNNNCTAETADIEQNKQNQRNERSNQGSDQSAWMFQAKLVTDPVNNNTNRDHLNGKQNLGHHFLYLPPREKAPNIAQDHLTYIRD